MGRSAWEEQELQRSQAAEAAALRQRRFVRFLISLAGLAVLTLVGAFTVVRPIHVKGVEIAVVEDWNGIEQTPVQPGTTRFLFPAFRKTAYVYNTGLQTFVMNDKGGKEETGSGRDSDAYRINSQEGQKMDVSMTLQYHVDPTSILHFHTSVHSNDPEVIGNNVIRPVLMRITKDNATVQTAISNYSGEGLVKLQQSVSTALTDPNGELRQKGIIVDTFVIEHIGLDPDYIGEIQRKQVAQQRTLRANEETKAAEAEALQAQAQAKADLNKRVVEAERDKQVAVLAAEAQKERTRLDAEAEKIKLVTTAEGTKEARTLEAAGILAVGQAEAAAQKLRLEAYNAPGSETFVRVEIAKYLSQGMAGIRGYLPQGMSVTTLGSSFNDAIDQVMGAAAVKTLGAPTPESAPKNK